jgi:hypothetical protein
MAVRLSAPMHRPHFTPQNMGIALLILIYQGHKPIDQVFSYFKSVKKKIYIYIDVYYRPASEV